MRQHLCPNCHNSYLAYCRECGHSYPFATTSICKHEPKHTENPDRFLYCASCGAQVDKEGVIVDGKLTMFPFVREAYKFPPAADAQDTAMKTATITETEDLGYKDGYVKCECGWTKELGDGFDGYKIANCPACTPTLVTRSQRKVIYGSGDNFTADIGNNVYFVLSNGLNIRYKFQGHSNTGLPLWRANAL